MSQHPPNGTTASGSKKSSTVATSLSPGTMAASRSVGGRLGTPGTRLSGGGAGRLGGSRLPSFKGQRDLTLGGTSPRVASSVPQSMSSGSSRGTSATENKKKFVPNLKVQRRKEEMKLEVRQEPTFDISAKSHKRDKQFAKTSSQSASGGGVPLCTASYLVLGSPRRPRCIRGTRHDFVTRNSKIASMMTIMLQPSNTA